MSQIEFTTQPLASPSILSSDFSKMGESLRQLEQAGADWIHLDVMDGNFVPNITFGPEVIQALRPHCKLPFDVHLMMRYPERYLKDFQQAGASLLTVHAHACQDLYRTLQRIRELGIKAGVSLSPATPLTDIEPVLDTVDLILVMAVSPGFGGQIFIPHTLHKLHQLKQMLGNRPIFIEVDGGITLENAAEVRANGAQVLVSGTTVFKRPDQMAAVIAQLKGSSQIHRPCSTLERGRLESP